MSWNIAMRVWLAVGCVLFAACSRTPESANAAAAAISPPAPVATPAGDPVEGLRVATRVGCNGCHERDGRGGGMDIKTPQGDHIVAPNLTKRRAFYDAGSLEALLRRGKTHDGHRPFGMPIFMFQHLSDQEVRDIAAWLFQLPPVENPGLGESRLSAASLQQIKDGTFEWEDDDKPDPGNAPPAVRPVEPLALGRHLALTSCSECHGRDLNGWGPDDPAPSLVVAKAYTAEKFARLMKTGEIATGGKSKTGFMSMIAAYRFSVLTDDEVAALKQYLDSR